MHFVAVISSDDSDSDSENEYGSTKKNVADRLKNIATTSSLSKESDAKESIHILEQHDSSHSEQSRYDIHIPKTASLITLRST